MSPQQTSWPHDAVGLHLGLWWCYLLFYHIGQLCTDASWFSSPFHRKLMGFKQILVVKTKSSLSNNMDSHFRIQESVSHLLALWFSILLTWWGVLTIKASQKLFPAVFYQWGSSRSGLHACRTLSGNRAKKFKNVRIWGRTYDFWSFGPG
jgi:hypothetical protein